MFSSFKRIATPIFAGSGMIAMALFCAFLSMRLAIHGREVEVPNFEGRTDGEAALAARELGLNLSVENRFYSSAIAQNHVLSQSPAPGSHVRRGWQVRITESLGAQRVSVPDVTGVTERPASLMLKRLQLEVSSVAHLPSPAPAGIVLSQSPPPNSSGLNGPTVSLLVSDEESAPDDQAFVMPSVIGLSLNTAALRLASVGLHIGTAQTPDEPFDPLGTDPAVPTTVYTAVASVTSQIPLAGHRITRADSVHVSMSH
jgi:beta-lactam-binding protein with PASTA domain